MNVFLGRIVAVIDSDWLSGFLGGIYSAQIWAGVALGYILKIVFEPVKTFTIRRIEFSRELRANVGYYYCYYVKLNGSSAIHEPHVMGMMRIYKRFWSKNFKVKFMLKNFDKPHVGIARLKGSTIYIETANKTGQIEDHSILFKPPTYAPLVLVGTWATVEKNFSTPICGTQVLSRRPLGTLFLRKLFEVTEAKASLRVPTTYNHLLDIQEQTATKEEQLKAKKEFKKFCSKSSC